MWGKPFLRGRINIGLYEKLVQELRFEDKSEYKNVIRMTRQDVFEILGLVQDDITVFTVPVTLRCSANLFLLFAFL